MVKKTGSPNPHLQELIGLLKKQASEQNVNIWKRIAQDLERPSRQRRAVNLYRIDRYTKENENVIVPGKVLAEGDINHKVTVAAFCFSDSAKQKIEGAKGQCLSIKDLLSKNPKGEKLRIIG